MNITNWCADLAAAITARTGDELVVRPRESSLVFECAWDEMGRPTLSTSIALPMLASKFASSMSAKAFADSVWASIGAWADFHQFWMDQQTG
jgi:hypothetical protein